MSSFNIRFQVILAVTLTGVRGDIWCPFHSKITWAGTGLIEGCKRRKCVLIICSFILLRFPMNVIGFSLEETVKIENTRIANLNDVDRRSDSEVRWASKTRQSDEIWLAVNLFHFRHEITWLSFSPDSLTTVVICKHCQWVPLFMSQNQGDFMLVRKPLWGQRHLKGLLNEAISYLVYIMALSQVSVWKWGL